MCVFPIFHTIKLSYLLTASHTVVGDVNCVNTISCLTPEQCCLQNCTCTEHVQHVGLFSVTANKRNTNQAWKTNPARCKIRPLDCVLSHVPFMSHLCHYICQRVVVTLGVVSVKEDVRVWVHSATGGVCELETNLMCCCRKHTAKLSTLTAWKNGSMLSLVVVIPLWIKPGLSGTNWAWADDGTGV